MTSGRLLNAQTGIGRIVRVSLNVQINSNGSSVSQVTFVHAMHLSSMCLKIDFGTKDGGKLFIPATSFFAQKVMTFEMQPQSFVSVKKLARAVHTAKVAVVMVSTQMTKQVFFVHETIVAQIAQRMTSMRTIVRVAAVFVSLQILSRVIFALVGKNFQTGDTEFAQEHVVFSFQVNFESFQRVKQRVVIVADAASMFKKFVECLQALVVFKVNLVDRIVLNAFESFHTREFEISIGGENDLQRVKQKEKVRNAISYTQMSLILCL